MKQNWIDAVKGFVIILVLLGHVEIPHLLHKLIYAFHVPFFFIVSGFLYNQTKYKQYHFVRFFIKRFKAYICPFLLISLFFCLCEIIQGIPLTSWQDILMSNRLYGYYRPLWFLPCFFLSHLLFYPAFKMKSTFMGFYFVFCFFIAVLLNDLYRFKPYYFWHIDISFLGVVLMYIGFVIKQKNLLDKPISIPVIFILLSISFLLSYNNKDINLYSHNITHIDILIIESSLTTFLIMYLFKKYVVSNHFLATFNNKFVFCFNFFMNAMIIDLFHISKSNWIIFSILDLICFYVVIKLIKAIYSFLNQCHCYNH